MTREPFNKRRAEIHKDHSRHLSKWGRSIDAIEALFRHVGACPAAELDPNASGTIDELVQAEAGLDFFDVADGLACRFGLFEDHRAAANDARETLRTHARDVFAEAVFILMQRHEVFPPWYRPGGEKHEQALALLRDLKNELSFERGGPTPPSNRRTAVAVVGTIVEIILLGLFPGIGERRAAQWTRQRIEGMTEIHDSLEINLKFVSSFNVAKQDFRERLKEALRQIEGDLETRLADVEPHSEEARQLVRTEMDASPELRFVRGLREHPFLERGLARRLK